MDDRFGSPVAEEELENMKKKNFFMKNTIKSSVAAWRTFIAWHKVAKSYGIQIKYEESPGAPPSQVRRIEETEVHSQGRIRNIQPTELVTTIHDWFIGIFI